MKALRWHARGDVRLDDVEPPPSPAPGEVQVRILWCGICGTDVEEFRNGPLFIPTEPHPLTRRAAPLTLGHEISGEVVAIGNGVQHVKVGQKVGVSPTISCGRCRWCRAGRPNLCEQTADLGLAADGGLAEYCNAPAPQTLPLPAGATSEGGALAEPLAVAIGALRRGRLQPSDRVVVFGGGAVGLLTLQAVKAMGVDDVTLVEPLPSRRAIAEELGAARTMTPDEIKDLAADLVVECSGSASAIRAAIGTAGRGGRVVLVGICETPVEIDPLSLVAEEKEILGSLGFVYDEHYTAAVDLIGSGRVQTEPIISDRIPLARALEEGLLALADHPERHLKILVSPAELS